MADSTIKNLTAKTTVVASDEIVINDVAGGNLDKKEGMDDIKTFMSDTPTLVTPALGTPGSGVLTSCTGLPLTTGVTGTLPVANGGTGVTTSTGSGANALATSPTLVTPALGTPASGVMTNMTGLPVAGLANGTDGELITWDSSGVAAVVAAGTATHVLTSNGAGAAPTFQAAAGGVDPFSDEPFKKLESFFVNATPDEFTLTNVAGSGSVAQTTGIGAGLRITSGASINNSSTLTQQNVKNFDIANHEMVFISKPENSVQFAFIGLLEANDIFSAQKIGIVVDTAGSANYTLTVYDGSTTTNGDTGITRDNAFHKWKIVTSPSLITCYHWESGAWTSKITQSTNLPGAAECQFGVGTRTLDNSASYIEVSYTLVKNTA